MGSDSGVCRLVVDFLVVVPLDATRFQANVLGCCSHTMPWGGSGSDSRVRTLGCVNFFHLLAIMVVVCMSTCVCVSLLHSSWHLVFVYLFRRTCVCVCVCVFLLFCSVVLLVVVGLVAVSHSHDHNSVLSRMDVWIRDSFSKVSTLLQCVYNARRKRIMCLSCVFFVGVPFPKHKQEKIETPRGKNAAAINTDKTHTHIHAVARNRDAKNIKEQEENKKR